MIYDEYYNPEPALKEMLTKHARAYYDYLKVFYTDKSLYNGPVPVELNFAVQHWLTFARPTQVQIQEILKLISPVESETAQTVFDTYYAKGRLEPNGRASNDFNGGYHTLACLYAASGSVDDVILTYEKMKSVGQMEYFNVPRVFNNHINVLGYLYLYDHKDKAPQLMVWLEANTINNPPATLLRNAVIRAGYMPSLISVNFFKGTRSYRGYFNLNLALAPRSVFHQLMNDYEKILSEIKDPSERNYSLALNNKRRAMFMSKYAFDRRMEQPTAQMGELFDKAISYYRQVPDNYLSENTDFTIIYYGDGVRNRTRTRRQLFVYPDYMEGWFSRPYHSDAFFLYMKEKNLLNDIYKTPEDLEMIHLWISKAFEVWPYFFVTFTNDFPLTSNTLKDVISFVNEHPNGNTFDKNLPAMVVANELFKNGEVDQAMKYYNTIDKATITRSSNRYEYIEKTFFLNQLRQLATNLALTDNQKEAVEIAELFENDYERVYVYMHMTDRTFKGATISATRHDVASIPSTPSGGGNGSAMPKATIVGPEQNGSSWVVGLHGRGAVPARELW
jgi:hypothetical protein